MRYTLLAWLWSPFAVGVLAAASCEMPPETKAAHDALVAARAKVIVAGEAVKVAYAAFTGDKTPENLAALVNATTNAAASLKEGADAQKAFSEAAEKYGTGGMPAWLMTVLTLLGFRAIGGSSAIMLPADSKVAKIISGVLGGSGLHNVGTPPTNPAPPPG